MTTLTIKEITAQYNTIAVILGLNIVKKFSTKAIAIARLEKINGIFAEAKEVARKKVVEPTARKEAAPKSNKGFKIKLFVDKKVTRRIWYHHKGAQIVLVKGNWHYLAFDKATTCYVPGSPII